MSRATTGGCQSVAPTAVWLSRSAEDGDDAQGFFASVVNGGSAGIVAGGASGQAKASDLNVTLTVVGAEDASSIVRLDLSNPAGVERVRLRLSRPDLGEGLLTSVPSGDGGWLLNGSQVAVGGAWHVSVIVRRSNVVDGAQPEFDFNIDPAIGQPQFP